MLASIRGEFLTAPIKGEERALEKVTGKYFEKGMYGARQLTDLLRGSLVFKDVEELCKVVNWMGSPRGSGKLPLKKQRNRGQLQKSVRETCRRLL